MLDDTDSTPTLVMCSMRSISDKMIDLSDKKTQQQKFEPLVLRTYSYPGEDGWSDGDSSSSSDLSYGSNFNSSIADRFYDNPSKITATSDLAVTENGVTLCEAMAGTSAVPGLVDRVVMDIGGEKRSVADGFLISNCPIAVAIDEARKLYPSRPLGVVLNFGFGTSCDLFEGGSLFDDRHLSNFRITIVSHFRYCRRHRGSPYKESSGVGSSSSSRDTFS